MKVYLKIIQCISEARLTFCKYFIETPFSCGLNIFESLFHLFEILFQNLMCELLVKS